MTDKQDTHDRTHTTEHSRRRTAATEHTAGRRIGGQAEGSTKTTHGSRQGTGRDQGESRQTEKSM